MPVPAKGTSDNAWMDGADTAAQSSWQRRMGRQRERRQKTEKLWGRLDDLVPDRGECSSPTTHALCRPRAPANMRN